MNTDKKPVEPGFLRGMSAHQKAQPGKASPKRRLVRRICVHLCPSVVVLFFRKKRYLELEVQPNIHRPG
jgi:hypothetical protein